MQASEHTTLTAGDLGRLGALLLGVAAVTWLSLLGASVLLVGAGLRVVIAAAADRSSAAAPWGPGKGGALWVLGLLLLGQAALSWALAPRLVPAGRRRQARRLALALSLLVGVVPVAALGLLLRQAQHQAQQRQHQERDAERRRLLESEQDRAEQERRSELLLQEQVETARQRAVQDLRRAQRRRVGR